MPSFCSHFQLDFDFEDISHPSNYAEFLVLLSVMVYTAEDSADDR